MVEKELLLEKEEENICIFYEDHLVEGGEKVQGRGLEDCARRNLVVLNLGTY